MSEKLDREALGKLVRDVWIRRAQDEPDFLAARREREGKTEGNR